MREKKEHKCTVIITVQAPEDFSVALVNGLIEDFEEKLYAQYGSDAKTALAWYLKDDEVFPPSAEVATGTAANAELPPKNTEESASA